MTRRAREILVASVAAALVAACQPPPSSIAGGAAGGGAGSTAVTGSAGRGGAAGSVPPGAGGDVECAAIQKSSATKLLPDVLILLDASGSMNDDVDGITCAGGCGPTSKWALATAALESIVAQTESTVNWGLKAFADSGTCSVNATVAVPVATMNAGAIATAIANRTSANGGVANGSNTPTRAAITNGATYLSTLSTLTDASPRFMLLVTDGILNCPVTGPTSADDSVAAIQAAAAARTLGFSTIVVGAATPGGPADAVLNNLAAAGGHAPAYIPLSNVGQLLTELPQLVTRAATCTFALPQGPTGSGPPRIGLRANGAEIPRDPQHQNGWDFTDAAGTAVQVFGPTCDDFVAGRIETLTIVFFCGRL